MRARGLFAQRCRPPFCASSSSYSSSSFPSSFPSSSLPASCFRYKLTIQYNGTALHGWQADGSPGVPLPSVHSRLSEACALAVGPDGAAEVVGSSRTDAGVHATGNVCHVDLVRRNRRTLEELPPHPPHVLQRALNASLGDHQIAVTAVEPASKAFHARFSARERTYQYRILAPLHNSWDAGGGGGGGGDDDRRNCGTYAYHKGAASSRTFGPPNRSRTAPFHWPPAVFDGHLAWLFPFPLDLDRMREAAAELVGTHDFTSLRGVKCSQPSAVRTLDELSIVDRDMAAYAALHHHQATAPNAGHQQHGQRPGHGQGPGQGQGQGTREGRPPPEHRFAAAVHEKDRGMAYREVVITARARSFLYRQVRNIVGLLVAVGRARLDPAAVPAILAARKRTAAPPTAPARGLYLTNVRYDDDKWIDDDRMAGWQRSEDAAERNLYQV